jgi:hypothetical protein
MRGEVLFLERVRRLYKIEGDAGQVPRRLGPVVPRECVKGGCGNDAENSPPKCRFLLPNHGYRDLCG